MVIWAILYVLIGVSVFVYIREGGCEMSAAWISFAVHMVGNLSWRWLFFSQKMVAAALLDIVVMWISILINILEFQKISNPAAYLLFPYLAWVTVAGYLTLYILLNNKPKTNWKWFNIQS